MPPIKKRSPLWNHFTEIKDGTKAKCGYCAQILSVPNKSIGNLGRHMKLKHPTIQIQLERQSFSTPPVVPAISLPSIAEGCGMEVDCNLEVPRPSSSNGTATSARAETAIAVTTSAPCTSKQSSMGDYMQRPVPVRKCSQIDRQVLKLIVKNYHPFSLVEQPEFKELFNIIIPGYKLPTRKTMSNSLLPKAYQECYEKVQTEINSAWAICLTTDSWTSINNVSFISLTAHYLDSNGNIKSYLLGCFPFSERHTSENLCNCLKQKMEEWKIQHKIVAVVSDNAANIVAAIREGGWRHIGCFAHSINLVVQASLSTLKEVLSKVKAIVEFFKRSSSGLAKLKEIQHQMGLPDLKLKQDVVTRWNSTYDMLLRFFSMKEAIVSTMAILGSDLQTLTADDWKIVEKAIAVLEIFYNITTEICSEKYVSISKVPVLCKIMIRHVNKHIEAENTSQSSAEIVAFLCTLKQQLAIRFQNVENNNLYAEATVLDPRFKKLGFRDIKPYETAISNMRRRLVSVRVQDAPSITVPDVPMIATTATATPTQSKSSLWEEFDAELKNTIPQNQTAAGIRELDKYLEDEMLHRNGDPLKWWEERQHIYPILYNYMKKRLCIMATSVPCERIFSKAGLTLNCRRTSLKDDKVSKILFLNCNIDE